MEKKNTGLIVTIIVLAVCLLGSLGYIAYDKFLKKEEPKQEEKKQEQKKDDVPLTEEQILEQKYKSFENNFTLKELESTYDKSGTELALVKNEVSKLLAYLNLQIDDAFDDSGIISACQLLNYYFPEFSLINSSQNLLLELEPEIMECMYNEKYTIVNDNFYNGSTILTKDQYDKLGEYFSEVVKLSKIEDNWVGYPTKDEDKDFYYEKVKPYFNKNYYYGYEIGDGFGVSGIYFEIDNIEKKDSNYVVNLNVYTVEYADTIGMVTKTSTLADVITNEKIVKYNAKLVAEVVNGHLKYHTLTIDK